MFDEYNEIEVKLQIDEKEFNQLKQLADESFIGVTDVILQAIRNLLKEQNV